MAFWFCLYQSSAYVITVLSAQSVNSFGGSRQSFGHSFGTLRGAGSSASQRSKNFENGTLTLLASTAGVRAVFAERGEGLIIRKTLSPLDCGFVCVPW